MSDRKIGAVHQKLKSPKELTCSRHLVQIRVSIYQLLIEILIPFGCAVMRKEAGERLSKLGVLLMPLWRCRFCSRPLADSKLMKAHRLFPVRGHKDDRLTTDYYTQLHIESRQPILLIIKTCSYLINFKPEVIVN